MKLAVIPLVLATLAATAPDAAAVAVKGEVVELACAASKGAGGRGDAHAACAMDCARKGLPMGLLVGEEIYEIAGDFTAQKNAKLLDFVARKVEAKGELFEQDGRKILNVSAMALVPPPKQ